MNRQNESLTLSSVYTSGGDSEPAPGSCSISTEFLVQVNPTDSIERLDFNCEAVDVPGAGTVTITGSVAFHKSSVVESDH
jgi:hypothetical protein